MFGALTVSIFKIFDMGIAAFRKTSIKNELLQQSQITNYRLTLDLERSAITSVSVAPNMLSFLSPLDDNDEFQMDAGTGRPEWQKYIIYYRSSSEEVTYRTEFPIHPSSSQREVPTPIEDYDDPVTGRRPLSFYATGGEQPLSRYVVEFDPEILPPPVSKVRWSLKLERDARGVDSTDPNRPLETFSTMTSTLLRN